MKSIRRARAGLIVFALAVTASCAPEAGVAPADAPTTSTPGATSTTVGPPILPDRDSSTVVVGVGTHGAPRTLNPLLDGPDAGVLDLVGHAVMARGYVVDPDTMDPLPVVLDDVPSLANGGIVDRGDGTVDVTVRVAPDAQWADGRPVTADDLAFTYRLAVDPDLPIRSDLRGRYALIVPGTVRAEGSTLTFRMERSIEVELLFDVIVPRHAVEGSDFQNDWNDSMWVSGGPFEFVSHQPGRYLELIRNDRYGGPLAGGAGFERLVFRFYDDDRDGADALLRSFEMRSLDVALIREAHVEAEGYRALEGEGARVATVPGLAWEHLNFQFGRANRNEDTLNGWPEYRAAIAHAIDRDALADRRGTAMLSSALRLYRPGLSADPWAAYAPDGERVDGALWNLSQTLGEDLFAGDGPPVVVTTSGEGPASVATAGEVVVMLSDAGFAAELQLEDSALFFGETLDEGTWDVATWRFTAGPGRASAIAFMQLFDPDGPPGSGYNFTRWGTAESASPGEGADRFRQILAGLDRSLDPAEIDRLLVEAEELLASEMVLLPLIVHEDVGVAWWADEVRGVTANPAGGAVWNVGTWRMGTPGV